MTQDLDTSISQVLEQIKKLGIANNTYVILTSDNGAGMRGSRNENLPLHGGKGTLWEGGIRVPLIIRGPGIKANSSLSENVIGYDLFPTICELAGVKAIPGNIEGISLVPLFSGKTKSFEKRQLIFHNPHYGIGPGQKPQSALIQGNYKIIKDLETGNFMLFDLDKDIGEHHDLSGSQPVLTVDMQKKLNAYLKKVNAQQPVKNKNYDPDATPGRRRPFNR
jgi:arylsulfatase A-like enzyme